MPPDVGCCKLRGYGSWAFSYCVSHVSLCVGFHISYSRESRETLQPEDFPADSPPVPLVFVIAAGAGDVEEDSAETGLSELSLHSVLKVCWLIVVFFRGRLSLASILYSRKRRATLQGGAVEWWNNGIAD